jgi:endosialidase-like protein
MEAFLNRITRLVVVVAGLVLLLNVTPSWGQPVCHSPGCNPTVSDANDNTAGGSNALKNVDETPITGGLFNTAFGSGALFSVVSGGGNTAFGADALSNNTADRNTALGLAVLESNDTGHDNTAIGANALTANTTGNLNTATGFQALFTNATGANNTAIGAKALKKSTGTKNIGIGYQAGVTLVTGNNNIYIGNQGNGDEFQTIRVGTAQAQTFIAGITGASVGNSSTVIIDTATGQLGIPTSSARYKRDIAPMGSQSEKVLQLRPVTFAYKSDAQGTTHYGLIAEEVAAVYPELVTHTASGEVQTVKYQELIPMLLNELQRQRQELAELRALVGRGHGAEVGIPSASVASKP